MGMKRTHPRHRVRLSKCAVLRIPSAPGAHPARAATFIDFVCISVYEKCVNSGEILRRLKEDGWYEVRTKGSHVQLKHPKKPGLVTLPHPKKDLPIGTVKSIERQSGVPILGR